MINRNTRTGPLDYAALREASMERRDAGRPSQMNLREMQPAGRPTFSKGQGATPPSVGGSGGNGGSLPIQAIAQALMNSNGKAFGGARMSGRNSLANMPGLQEGLARRRMQQPMAPQPQQPVQFTQPRVHAQAPGGASARWMELFRG